MTGSSRPTLALAQRLLRQQSVANIAGHGKAVHEVSSPAIAASASCAAEMALCSNREAARQARPSPSSGRRRANAAPVCRAVEIVVRVKQALLKLASWRDRQAALIAGDVACRRVIESEQQAGAANRQRIGRRLGITPEIAALPPKSIAAKRANSTLARRASVAKLSSNLASA